MAEKSAARSLAIEDAKATIIAYNNKDWNAVRAALASKCIYDEVATHRRVEGTDQIIPLWQGWAAALPDSKATLHRELVSGSTVTIELTWRGMHTGVLQLPKGPLAPTGRPVELRACQVIEVEAGKTRSITQYFDMATLLQQLGV